MLHLETNAQMNTSSLHPAPALAPFVEADARSDAAEFRCLMNENGYLFFRGLVPSEAVLEVRRAALELCAQAGWLDPSRDLMEGIAAPGSPPLREGLPEYMAVYRQILKTAVFHDFPMQPALLQVAEKLLQGEILVHPRRIGRLTWPNLVSAATPAHQDWHYIRGAVETYSCWMPLGACPVELGALAVASGSHHQGFIAHTRSLAGAVGGQAVPPESEAGIEWHSSDFGVGDALFFHSYTIHKALPNLTPDRLRLSTDNRFQRAQDSIDPGSLQPHFGAS